MLRNKFYILVAVIVLGMGLTMPNTALANDNVDDNQPLDNAMYLSEDLTQGSSKGASFSVSEFYRAQKGSNRPVDDTYYGYLYLLGPSQDIVSVAVLSDEVIVYIPESLSAQFNLDVHDPSAMRVIQDYIVALDEANAGGYDFAHEDMKWTFTSEETYQVGQYLISFGQEYKEGYFYLGVSQPDGSDTSQVDPSQTGVASLLTHVDTFALVDGDSLVVPVEKSVFGEIAEFLRTIDYSPLWVTLKTTGVAIVIVFFLGLLAAWWSLRIPLRIQDIVDTIFTIPMVLPPTVCGFILLLCLGGNSPVGQWFDEIGFPLIFSWPATVIAATVVSFPLMYRSARGAFENLDSNMLDAARTLGWSESKIFFKLMLPLAWSSIAAGTVLAYARALGEFGATLFMAGNYVGITRTIPLAIYFEWMSGNTDVAIFWTIVVLIFSFIVILFINLWSRHTTKYRRRDPQDA